MKKLRLITGLFMTIVVLFLAAVPVSAMPPMPSTFYGTVKLNVVNVPVGSLITARVNGVTYTFYEATLYQTDSVYRLIVPGEDTDIPGIQGGVEGDTVVFFIGPFQASQSGTWHSGTLVNLNITATGTNHIPTNIQLSADSIAENQPAGTVVGTFASTDSDSGDMFQYSLVPGTGSADNASFTIEGNSLKTAASFNFEFKSSYSIRVRTTDMLMGTYEKIFTITVTNVNEPPVIDQGPFINVTMSRDGDPTPFSLNLTAVDPDAGETLSWSVIDPADHGTASASGTGASIEVGYTPQSGYTGADSFTVQVQDSGGLTDSILVNVTISPVNWAIFLPYIKK